MPCRLGGALSVLSYPCQALLRFHTMKIADINKIIRELWAMTYSGEDIDMIEIVSGDDEETGKAKR